jgi:hypothetical protein
VKYGSATARVDQLPPDSERSVTGRKRNAADDRAPGRGAARVQRCKETKSQVSTGRIASDSDLCEVALDQAEIGRPNVLRRGREWMLRREPVVGHKCLHACLGCDMAHQMPVSVSRAQVEPSTMNMQHYFSGARIFRAAPDSRDPSNMVSFVGHTPRRCHTFHDAVEGNAGGRSSQAALIRFDDRSHGDHRGGVLGIDRME